jgi:hypothetical protein
VELDGTALPIAGAIERRGASAWLVDSCVPWLCLVVFCHEVGWLETFWG